MNIPNFGGFLNSIPNFAGGGLPFGGISGGYALISAMNALGSQTIPPLGSMGTGIAGGNTSIMEAAQAVKEMQENAKTEIQNFIENERLDLNHEKDAFFRANHYQVDYEVDENGERILDESGSPIIKGIALDDEGNPIVAEGAETNDQKYIREKWELNRKRELKQEFLEAKQAKCDAAREAISELKDRYGVNGNPFLMMGNEAFKEEYQNLLSKQGEETKALQEEYNLLTEKSQYPPGMHNKVEQLGNDIKLKQEDYNNEIQSSEAYQTLQAFKEKIAAMKASIGAGTGLPAATGINQANNGGFLNYTYKAGKIVAEYDIEDSGDITGKETGDEVEEE